MGHTSYETLVRSLRRTLGLFAVVMALATATGCDVNGFLLGADAIDGGGGGGDEDGGGDGGGGGDEDGGGGGGGDEDGGDGCIPIAAEDTTCDGVDDDCDGMADESINPNLHCGACGNACNRPGATGTCVSDACVYECQFGQVDLNDDLNNADNSNGCEYDCTASVAPEDSADLCDLSDDDCDGAIDEDADTNSDVANCGGCGNLCFSLNAQNGGACVNGECERGTCVDGFLDCDNEDPNNPTEFSCDPQNVKGIPGCEYDCPVYPAQTETCDGVDEDCDGRIDEDFDIGADCDNGQQGACFFAGVTVCNDTGDGARCTAEGLGLQPTEEVCDGTDNDCDGVADYDVSEDSPPDQTQFDVNNCGVCGNVCSEDTSIVNADSYKCVTGTCERDQCSDGWVDIDDNGANGCNYQCTPTPGGSEICDGLDNDCNGDIDTDDTNFVNAPTVTCKTAGECNGSGSPVCGKPGEDSLATLTACDTASAPTGWYCNYDDPDIALASNCRLAAQESADDCDSLDNDCDGDIDERWPEVANIGEPNGDECTTGTTGICQGSGFYVCNDTNDGIECDDSGDPPQTALTYEECNGEDDNCDGVVDEDAVDDMVMVTFQPLECLTLGAACIDPTGELEGTCVGTDGGGDDCAYWIDKYEASRPDADDTSPGSDSNLSCSLPDRMPWSLVDKNQAELACAGNNKRLCTQSEWELACAGIADNTYPYGDSYDAFTCNGADWNPDCNPPGQDQYSELEVTGYGYSPGGSPGSCTIAPVTSCESEFLAVDMSGNLREWTSSDPDSVGSFKVRGGSFTEPRQGITCQNDFVTLAPDSSFNNLGFRCCRSDMPPQP